MKVYNYNETTGEFVSEGQADLSPLEEGVWLMPAYSTTIEPLPSIPGKICCFIDGQWKYQDVVEHPDTDLSYQESYRYKRLTAYPPIGDQLDALFKAGAFPPEMAAQIQAVKDQFPKE